MSTKIFTEFNNIHRMRRVSDTLLYGYEVLCCKIIHYFQPCVTILIITIYKIDYVNFEYE